MSNNNKFRDLLVIGEKAGEKKTTQIVTLSGWLNDKGEIREMSKRSISDLFDFFAESEVDFTTMSSEKLSKSLDKRFPGISSHLLLNHNEDQKGLQNFTAVLAELHEEMNEQESQSNPLTGLCAFISGKFTLAEMKENTFSTKLAQVIAESLPEAGKMIQEKATKNGTKDGFVLWRKAREKKSK